MDLVLEVLPHAQVHAHGFNCFPSHTVVPRYATHEAHMAVLEKMAPHRKDVLAFDYVVT